MSGQLGTGDKWEQTSSVFFFGPLFPAAEPNLSKHCLIFNSSFELFVLTLQTTNYRLFTDVVVP